jgi:catechol 2,3-dioxygenase-like lactoylglutathione lyase family enzyme
MFDHVKFGVSDFEASKAFSSQALEPLGVVVVARGRRVRCRDEPKGKGSLVLHQTDGEAGASSPGVHGETRQQVEAFYRASLEAVARTTARLACARTTMRNYYAAFVIGPDGHNIEVVCHEPRRERQAS